MGVDCRSQWSSSTERLPFPPFTGAWGPTGAWWSASDGDRQGFDWQMHQFKQLRNVVNMNALRNPIALNPLIVFTHQQEFFDRHGRHGRWQCRAWTPWRRESERERPAQDAQDGAGRAARARQGAGDAARLAQGAQGGQARRLLEPLRVAGRRAHVVVRRAVGADGASAEGPARARRSREREAARGCRGAAQGRRESGEAAAQAVFA